MSFVFMAKVLAQVCEYFKADIKLELKEFRESWDRDFRKELLDVMNSMPFLI